MEALLSFVNKFGNVIKDHLEETKEYLGKDIVDSKAVKTGICVDKIKQTFGAKFSLLGHNYKESELKQIEGFNEDVLVCQGNNGRFFIPTSEVTAVGESVLLVNSNLNYPEATTTRRTREEVFRKYYKVREALKTVFPQLKEPVKKRKAKKKFAIKLFH